MGCAPSAECQALPMNMKFGKRAGVDSGENVESDCVRETDDTACVDGCVEEREIKANEGEKETEAENCKRGFTESLDFKEGASLQMLLSRTHAHDSRADRQCDQSNKADYTSCPRKTQVRL